VTDIMRHLARPILRRLVYADKKTRAWIQRYGMNVLPVNFYSNTPSIEEIENSYEYASDAPPYLNTSIFDPGVLQRTLERLFGFSAEFAPPQKEMKRTVTASSGRIANSAIVTQWRITALSDLFNRQPSWKSVAASPHLSLSKRPKGMGLAQFTA